MIAADAARDAAAAALAELIGEGDPLLAPWLLTPLGTPSVGAPVVVHDVEGAFAYWLAPLQLGDRVIGAARIGAGGGVMTIGVTCRTPHRVADCPSVVTGLTAGEATAKARAEIGLDEGETPAPPRFVHDGPPGREAWLVETMRSGRPFRWILVTRGGCAARPAGVRIGDAPGVE